MSQPRQHLKTFKAPEVGDTLENIKAHYNKLKLMIYQCNSHDEIDNLEQSVKMAHAATLSKEFSRFLNAVPNRDGKYKGYTRLARAVAENEIDLVNFLIEHRADILLAVNNPRGPSLGNRTPLYIAAEAGNLTCVRTLITEIHNHYSRDERYVQYINPTLNVAYQNGESSQISALEAAITNNHQEVAEAIFNESANLHPTHLYYAFLKQAIEKQMPELVDRMLKQKNQFMKLTSHECEQLLQSAIQMGQAKAVAWLLVNVPIKPRVEHLIEAVKGGHIEVVKKLIAKRKAYPYKELEKVCLVANDRALLNYFLPGLIDDFEESLKIRKAAIWSGLFRAELNKQEKAVAALKILWSQPTYSREELNSTLEQHPILRKGRLNVLLESMNKTVDKKIQDDKEIQKAPGRLVT